MAALQDMPIYPDLKGKVVIVTGIGQQGDPQMWGNGAATARVFALQGSKVVGCDINLPSAEHTKQRIEDELRGNGGGGGKISVLQADVTKSDDVERLVKDVVGRYGRVDVLVNNVGMSQPGGPVDMPENIWDAQMDVNLKSVYLCCKHVLPHMLSQNSGAVVNLASIAALRYIGKPQIAYSATKAAIIQFTRATALIHANAGVRMNVVVPGLIHTPLIGSLAEKYNNGDVEGLVKKRDAGVPLGGKMGQSIDVAYAVVWLASSVAARHVTGQKVVVDGGIVGNAVPG